MLDPGRAQDPVRGAMEEQYRLEPVDTLEPATLAKARRLLLVQPRVLGGPENVALDDWVRKGGHAVIFADPLLTRPTQYALGDPRRPQDVVILSPILRRWGLELFENFGSPAQAEAPFEGEMLAVDEPGRFAVVSHDTADRCTVAASGLSARCTVGEGQVALFADAAAFDIAAGDTEGSARLVRAIARALGD